MEEYEKLASEVRSCSSTASSKTHCMMTFKSKISSFLQLIDCVHFKHYFAKKKTIPKVKSKTSRTFLKILTVFCSCWSGSAAPSPGWRTAWPSRPCAPCSRSWRTSGTTAVSTSRRAYRRSASWRSTSTPCRLNWDWATGLPSCPLRARWCRWESSSRQTEQEEQSGLDLSKTHEGSHHRYRQLLIRANLAQHSSFFKIFFNCISESKSKYPIYTYTVYIFYLKKQDSFYSN